MSSPSNWTPPFLVGVAMAVTAEMALGLLLYNSAGLLPALTLVLGFQACAFGVGMASAPRSPKGSRSWRWLACAGALFAAAIAALLWDVVETVPAGWPRGLSVTLFAALPMYCFGLVFAGMEGTREKGSHDSTLGGIALPRAPRPRRGSISDRRRTGAPAALGATAGIVLFGVLLLPRLVPVSIYMFALLCVAMAAMVEGTRSESALRRPAPAPASTAESTEVRSAVRPPASVVAAPDRPESAVDGERIPSIAEFAPDPPER